MDERNNSCHVTLMTTVVKMETTGHYVMDKETLLCKIRITDDVTT